MALSLASCSYRPILDPNEHYSFVGREQAEKDIDNCEKQARDYLDQFKAERAAKEAGRKAIIGGVIGAGTGLIMGKNVRSTLIGSAVGAGVGAAIGGLSVLGEDKVKPDQIKQKYITKCLTGKGYSVIGWR